MSKECHYSLLCQFNLSWLLFKFNTYYFLSLMCLFSLDKSKKFVWLDHNVEKDKIEEWKWFSAKLIDDEMLKGPYFKIINIWRKGKWQGNFVGCSIGDYGWKAGRTFKIYKYLRLLFSALSKIIELRFWIAILRRHILNETFF